VASQAVIIVIAIIVEADPFGPLPGCLAEVAEPVCHFPNIPKHDNQYFASMKRQVENDLHPDFEREGGSLFDGWIGRFYI
jgi:hypothetical protein